MLKMALQFIVLAGFTVTVLLATPQDRLTVKRLDLALDKIVPLSANLETVLTGYEFLEGPNWIRDGSDGYLIFSDIPGNAIRKMTPDKKVSVIVNSIFTGSDTSLASQYTAPDGKKVAMIGPDGTTIDNEGRIVYCDGVNRRVVRVEKDGERTVLAERFEGKRINRPNDLVYKEDGSLYFTDTQKDIRRVENDPDKGPAFTGVYLVKGKSLQNLTKDIPMPNGLAFSPDEKYLFVNSTAQKTITRFDVNADDTIANPRLLIDMNIDMSSGASVGAPDGMRVDRNGNIYCTGPGGLWILSPEGKHLGTILTPQRLTNIAFGDKDGKTLYMTAPTALYRIRLNVVGKTFTIAGR
jgi:gluconolactonase